MSTNGSQQSLERNGSDRPVQQVVTWARETMDAVEAQAHEAQQRATHLFEEAKEQLVPMDRWLRETAKEQPLLVVGASVGVGFLAGCLIGAITRRMR